MGHGNDLVVAPTAETPFHGWASFRHWREDLVAGLLVSLISLPFSLGIAVASGAPPIAGLVSAIIAGLLFPLIGGSYLTISGPAAGLAPILLASMTTLGQGNLERGYPLLLAVISVVGIVQMILSWKRAALLCAILPTAVVEGMLCSIGLLIIAKQLPNLIGRPFHAHEFFGILLEAPHELAHLDPKIFLLGAACLCFIFGLEALKLGWLRILPPQVLAAAFGAGLGAYLGIEPEQRIQLPEAPLAHGFVLPDYLGILRNSTLLLAAGTAVATLTLVDGIESLATAMAIDRLDPFRRKSNPNRVLLAMGISNLCSSVAGGLTIIPGGVKSKACIVAGGRTLWANFYNALFLLAYLFLFRGQINHIPLSTLAAMLIYTGYRMCEPKVWRHVAAIGREQLFVFSGTVFATLATDLLIGIGVGVALKLLVNAHFIRRGGRGDASPLDAVRAVVVQFRDPTAAGGAAGDGFTIRFERPLVCFNSLYVRRALASIPGEAKRLRLQVTDGCTLIDHTSCENLLEYVRSARASSEVEVEVLGLEDLRGRSDHESCMRLKAAVRPVESAEEPLDFETFSPETMARALADLGRRGLVRTPVAVAAAPHDDLGARGLLPLDPAKDESTDQRVVHRRWL